MRIACAVLLLLGACSSVSVGPDAPGSDGGGGGDGGIDSTADAAPVWMEVASYQFTEMADSPDAVTYGTTVYLARKDTPQWLKAWDSQTMVLTDKTASANVCNCGYVGTLVAVPGNGLYYFANEGNRYDPTTDTWSAATYDAANRRGEAATGEHAGLVWMVGGRDTPYTTERFTPSTMTWEAPVPIADYPWALHWGTIVSLEGGLYVLGGDTGDSRRHLNLLNATIWDGKPNAPFDVERPSATAAGGRIVAVSSTSGAMAIFDPAGGGAWTVQPLPPGITGDKVLAYVDPNLYLFFQTGSTLRVARYIGPF